MITINDFLHATLLRVGNTEITAASLAVGLLVLAISVIVGRLVQRLLIRMLDRRGLSLGSQVAVAKIGRYAIVVIGAAIAVSSTGINIAALLAASTVLLVGLGFGLQNIAQNFVSGLILLIEQPVRAGDFIQLGQNYGVVEDIGLRATRIITRDQVAVIVPNSELVSAQVINHSRPTTHLRISVSVGVAYGSDLAQVRASLVAVGASDRRIQANPGPEVRFLGFGDSSLEFALLMWISDPREDLRIQSDIRFAIDAEFRREGISIPFPQRDLHIASGQRRESMAGLARRRARRHRKVGVPRRKGSTPDGRPQRPGT